MMETLRQRGFEREFTFRTSRSSGKGGQHVNKVSTKVELVFNVAESKVLDVEEKERVKERLSNKLSSKGDLRIVTEMTRSQLKNKEISIERFYQLMEKALKRPKYRKPTAPTKSSIDKRFKKKHLRGEKKQNRKKIDPNRASD